MRSCGILLSLRAKLWCAASGATPRRRDRDRRHCLGAGQLLLPPDPAPHCIVMEFAATRAWPIRAIPASTFGVADFFVFVVKPALTVPERAAAQAACRRRPEWRLRRPVRRGRAASRAPGGGA